MSASDDAEASMISKLKQACGFEYTSKLQRMFQVLFSPCWHICSIAEPFFSPAPAPAPNFNKFFNNTPPSLKEKNSFIFKYLFFYFAFNQCWNPTEEKSFQNFVFFLSAGAGPSNLLRLSNTAYLAHFRCLHLDLLLQNNFPGALSANKIFPCLCL